MEHNKKVIGKGTEELERLKQSHPEIELTPSLKQEEKDELALASMMSFANVKKISYELYGSKSKPVTRNSKKQKKARAKAKRARKARNK